MVTFTEDQQEALSDTDSGSGGGSTGGSTGYYTPDRDDELSGGGGQDDSTTATSDDNVMEELDPGESGQDASASPTGVDTTPNRSGDIDDGQLQNRMPGPGEVQPATGDPMRMPGPGEIEPDTTTDTPPGELLGTGVEQGGQLPYGSASARQRRERAQRLERQIIQQNPQLTRGDVQINLFRSSDGLFYDPQITASGRRDVAAADFSAAVGAPVESDDVALGDDGGATLTSEFYREQAAERFQEAGVDVSSAEIQFDDGQVSLPANVRRQDAAEQFRQQGLDVTASDIALGDGSARLTESAQERIRERMVKEQLGVETDLTAQELGRERGYSFSIEEGEDYVVTDDGGIRLTAEGRRAAITSRLLEQGYVDIPEESATIPVIGGELGAGETTRREITDISQLEFDEQGQLVGVRVRDKTGLAGGVQGVSQLGGAINEEIIQPGAEVGGDVQSSLAQTVDIANPFDDEGAAEAGADAVASYFDIVRGEQEEIGEPTFTESATTKTLGGAGSLATIPLQLPQTGYTLGQESIEAVEFTGEQIAEEGVVEGTGDALTAAGGAAVEYAEQQAISTINNPYRTAGALAGSAAIMGGAAAVSSRAGLATRLAIQPAEEAIGYGGAGLFRRLPGKTTTRIGQRAFPNNEPLIFSEEAAIRAGQRVKGGLSNTLASVRQGGVSDISLGGVRSRIGETRQQLPSARVTTEGDGRVSMSEPLQRDMRLGLGVFERGVAGNIVGAKNTIKDLPETARETAKRSAVRAKNTRQDFPGQRTTGAAVSADRSILGSLVRAQNVREDAPDMIDRSLRRGRVEAINRAQDIRMATSRRFQEGAFNLEQDVQAGLVRVGNLPQDVSFAAKRGSVSGLVGAQNLRQDIGIAAGQRATGAAVTADRALLSTLARAQNRRADSPGLRDRAAKAGDSAEDLLAETLVKSKNRVQDLEIEAGQRFQEGAFNVEQDALAGLVRAQNLRSDVPEIARETATTTLVGAQNLRQDIGIRARQQATASAYDVDRGVLAAAVKAENLRQDFPGNVRDVGLRSLVGAQNVRQDIGDLGIVFEPGKPARTVSANELDVGDAGVEFDADFDSGQSQFGGGEGFDQPSGSGQRPTIMATESGTETGTATETVVVEAPERRAESRDGGMASEAADIPFKVEPTTPEPSFDVSSNLDTSLDSVATPTVSQGGVAVQTPGSAVDVESGQRLSVESGLETETDQETDIDQEQRLFTETETEQETEIETELELENEFEVEAEDRRRKQRQQADGDLELGSATETFAYGVADPTDVISGDILND